MSPESARDALRLAHLMDLLLLLPLFIEAFLPAAGLVAAGLVTAAFASVCWTAKQPPNGPATAALRHRTVHTFPGVPVDC